MSSREKIGLHEREKHPPPALQSSPAEDEEEEGQTGQSQAKASSSSSSEEESESESDAESGGMVAIVDTSVQIVCCISFHQDLQAIFFFVFICAVLRKSKKQRNHKQLEQQTKHHQHDFYLHASSYHCKPSEKGIL